MNFEFIGTLGIGALLALGAYVFFVYSQRARGVNALGKIDVQRGWCWGRQRGTAAQGLK